MSLVPLIENMPLDVIGETLIFSPILQEKRWIVCEPPINQGKENISYFYTYIKKGKNLKK